MNAHIVLLPGDGIGPEVVNEARLVLEAIAKRHGHQFKFNEQLLGGCAIDAKGTAMPDETLAACQAADAVVAIPTIWLQVPDELKALIPAQGMAKITVLVAVAGLIGRFVDQRLETE